MKFQETECQHLDRSVYEKIADKYGKNIPIMKSLSGDQEGKAVHINFRVFGRINAQVEQMATKCQYLNNKSEIHRAGHYLGVMILYHLLMRKEQYAFKLSSIYEAMLSCEDLDYQYQLLDDAVRSFKKVYNAYRSGIVSIEQANERIEGVLDALPENLQELSREKCRMIFDGRKLAEVLEERQPGRPFSIK